MKQTSNPERRRTSRLRISTPKLFLAIVVAIPFAFYSGKSFAADTPPRYGEFSAGSHGNYRPCQAVLKVCVLYGFTNTKAAMSAGTHQVRHCFNPLLQGVEGSSVPGLNSALPTMTAQLASWIRDCRTKDPNMGAGPVGYEHPTQPRTTLTKVLSLPSTATSWTRAGIIIQKNMPLSISATGRANFGAGYQGIGPKGVVSGYHHCKAPDAQSFDGGALLAKIGLDGSPFFVGESFSTSASPKSGELYVTINDTRCAQDNTGNFTLTIDSQRGPPKDCEIVNTEIMSKTWCYCCFRGVGRFATPCGGNAAGGGTHWFSGSSAITLPSDAQEIKFYGKVGDDYGFFNHLSLMLNEKIIEQYFGVRKVTPTRDNRGRVTGVRSNESNGYIPFQGPLDFVSGTNILTFITNPLGCAAAYQSGQFMGNYPIVVEGTYKAAECSHTISGEHFPFSPITRREIETSYDLVLRWRPGYQYTTYLHR